MVENHPIPKSVNSSFMSQHDFLNISMDNLDNDTTSNGNSNF